MKKFLFATIILALSLSLFSCVKARDNKYTVTFVTEGGSTSKTVSEGSKISFPEVERKENYIFDGWYYDKEMENPVSLTARVESNLTLYAKYEYDYKSATNEIFSKYIEMNVDITAISYNTYNYGKIEEIYTTGSGVIFYEEANFYYILTNSHVVDAEQGYSSVRYEVFDCYGTKMLAPTLIASYKEYDLAILRFRKGDEMLYVADFANTVPEEGDVAIALGQPWGLNNALTYGNVKIQEVLTENTEGEIDFSVICHNAPIEKGSSGGALLNDSFEIIGINFASAIDKNTGEILGGLAIPAEKVLEFIDKVL